MGNRSALLIGVSQYRDQAIEDMAAPVNDVDLLKPLFEDRVIGRYRTRQLRDPTEARARRAITSFFRNTAEDDTLLFYYSGHGKLCGASPDSFHMLMRDSSSSKLQDAPDGVFLLEEFHRSPAKRKVIIVDACHSGWLCDHSDAVALTVFGRDASKASGRGTAIITSTDVSTVSVAGKTISQFTRILERGIATGDADSDETGKIMVKQIAYYVQNYSPVSRQQSQNNIKDTVPITIAFTNRERGEPPVVKPGSSLPRSVEDGWNDIVARPDEQQWFFLMLLRLKTKSSIEEDSDYLDRLWRNYVGERLDIGSGSNFSWHPWGSRYRNHQRLFIAPYHRDNIKTVARTAIEIVAMKTPADLNLGLARDAVELDLMVDVKTILAGDSHAQHGLNVQKSRFFKQIAHDRPNCVAFPRLFADAFAKEYSGMFEAGQTLGAQQYIIQSGKDRKDYSDRQRIF